MPHIHDKIDYTIEVFIVYQDKVLLRKHDKLGIWLSIGGHVELDEDPNEAAVREVKEEVGLDISLDASLLPPTPPTPDDRDLIPPFYMHRNRMNDTHEHITFIYFAKIATDQLILSESEKTDDIRWFSKEDLEKDTEILPNIKYYALQALQKLSLK